jgi:REP-associated tyrosine transposase
MGEDAINGEKTLKDDLWSQAVAVGSLEFVEQVKSELGLKAKYRKLEETRDAYVLREQSAAYSAHFAYENNPVSPNNTISWIIDLDNTGV